MAPVRLLLSADERTRPVTLPWEAPADDAQKAMRIGTDAYRNAESLGLVYVVYPEIHMVLRLSGSRRPHASEWRPSW
jgi:hypothetical protein